MIKKYTPEEIAKIRTTLPTDLQQALGSVDLMNELAAIVKEKRLHVDQAGTLADIVELTLAGLLRTREFIRTLAEMLPELKQDEILGVAEQVSKRIFSQVQASLKQIDQAESERLTVAETLSVPNINGGTERLAQAPERVESVPLPQVPIHELKSAAAISIRAATTDVSHINTDPTLHLVPNDFKTRINSDPYKEPIG